MCCSRPTVGLRTNKIMTVGPIHFVYPTLLQHAHRRRDGINSSRALLFEKDQHESDNCLCLGDAPAFPPDDLIYYVAPTVSDSRVKTF